MKPFLKTLAVLACTALPAFADITAEKVLLVPHDGGPRVCVMLRQNDTSLKEPYGTLHGEIYTTLYARKDANSDWQLVREWQDPSVGTNGPGFSHDILTENNRVLKDMDGHPWEAKVVIENPGKPANQKILYPTFDTAGR